MIAASEPLEFVPHGRTVLENHPGKIYSRCNKSSLSENSLLYKLTNFAIKDESLIEGRDDDEQEWWCVREVFARRKEDFEDDPPPTKDSKDEYMSESFRPQSRLKNDFNISIKSELAMKKGDAECGGPAGTSRGGSANSSSNMSKKFSPPSQPSPSREKPLSHKTDCCYEEELYVKGCTAVWSKGLTSAPATRLSGPESRETIACFTIEAPIRHAVFCNFHVGINNTMLIDALNSQIGDVKKNIKIEDTTEHLATKNMPSILLVDNKNVRVYATDGREYVTSIPFQVKKVWPMKYGVLFEKEAIPSFQNSMLPASFLKFNESQNSTFSRSKNAFPFNMSARLRQESLSAFDSDVPLPTCFSMSHPLDEVTPILMKSPSQGLQYYNDGDLQIIFVSTNPSIILLYDWKLGTHSLWYVRKAVREECLTMCPNMNSTTTVFSQTCEFPGSPMNSVKNVTSWATGAGSPHHSKRGSGTPIMSRSRVNSPMANIFHQQGLSPHASIGHASSVTMMANTCNQAPPSLPLYPEICLDHIWTDTQSIRRDPIENQSDMKSFLHTDLVGHDYLCFMVKVDGSSRLQIVRLQKSHSHGKSSKMNLIVGSITSVSAKDAVVLDHLQMIALIDDSGNIILQSGASVVGKVHVGGVLARLLATAYAAGGLPRRSSLLPSRRDAPLDDSALHLLSPVAPVAAAPAATGLQTLRDAAGTRLTLVFDKSTMYRITLPDIARSSRVIKCCGALRAILPKDVTMQVIIKWYGVRNAPGTQELTPEQEWSMFANLLYTLIGYDLERMSLPRRSDDHGETSEVATKKQRTSSDGTQDDWDYLLNSKLHKNYGNTLASLLNLPQTKADSKARPGLSRKKSQNDDKTQFNANALLFPYTAQVLFAFHLLYEDTKLNTLLLHELQPLSSFLYQLAKDLKLDKYVTHYWLDFPTGLCLEYEEQESQMTEGCLKRLLQPSYFSSEPPSVFAYVNSMLKDEDAGVYPYLVDVNEMSKNIVEIVSVSTNTRGRAQNISAPPSSTPRAPAAAAPAPAAIMAELGITQTDIDRLSPCIRLLLLSIQSSCRGLPLAVPEIMAQNLPSSDVSDIETAYTLDRRPETDRSEDKEAEPATGMEHLNTKLLRLLYPKDHRMTEVFNLLQSSIPISINLTQRPEVSDHDFLEEQEKYLFAVSSRTTALPIARGMVTLRTIPWGGIPPDAAPPPLTVWGRGPAPRRAAVQLAAPPSRAWPSFHNGCAHALANRETLLTGTVDMSHEHAGYLLGLGLNGQLKDMPFMHIYEHLVKCQQLTSVGLLLGLAATYRGTMDVQATKMMSIHLEPLLPPTSIELDIHQHLLVAALLGAGLIYQETRHAPLARVLTREIGKPPGPDMEHCTEREGYALAAGLALGFVYVGAGDEIPSYIPQCLRTYMLGGDPPSKLGYQKDRSKSGDKSCLNLDVSSGGATLALGLIYLGTGSRAVAQWLRPPPTAYLLDAARPHALMCRAIAIGLIMWHEVEPTEEWVESQVPDTIKPYCFVKPTEDNIDYEAMNQAYCNIVAGACFTLGLRYAGSGLEEARDTALHYTNLFLTLAGKSLGELAGRSTLESCLCVCLLAAAMVMSGRGDIAVHAVCRRLRARVPRPAAARAPALEHGPQMAVHMALGLLHLCGGRGSLGTSPAQVAALLTSLHPHFPTHTNDNRYHLQAFRHLYVLAVEERLILPRDVNTGRLCLAHIQVVDLAGAVKEMKAPCILPELRTLKEVRVHEPRYWPRAFTRETNWDQLEALLANTWCVDIKPRAGCLSYLDDPQGFQTILAQTLTLDKTNVWSATLENIELFTSDEKVRSFTKHYLSSLKDSKVGANICPDCMVLDKKRGKKVRSEGVMKECQCRKYGREELEFVQGLSMATYECVVKDILCALPVWTTFLKILKTMKTDPSAYHIWQIKLLLSQIENHNKRYQNEMKIDGEESTQTEPLISNEFTLAISQKVGDILDGFEAKIQPFVRKYLGLPSSRRINQADDLVKKILSAYLVFYDIPKGVLRGANVENTLSLLLEVESLGLSVTSVSKVEALL